MDFIFESWLTFWGQYGKMILPHKFIIFMSLACIFALVKMQALLSYAFGVRMNLCGNKWNCAFFSVWLCLGLHTFLFLQKEGMHMKKAISLLLALVLCLSLCACGLVTDTLETNGDTENSNTMASQDETAGTPEPSTSETAEVTTNPAAEATSEPTAAPTTEPPTVPKTEPPTEPSTEPPTEPPHVHSFSAATCTAPRTCSCGATEGSANGHNWKDATYTSPKTCAACGATEGNPLDVPGKENYHGHVYTGGEHSKKFHYEADCAGKNSHEITWDEVTRRNLGPCGTCVLK